MRLEAGTVRFGAATLTFAPGSLPSDAWVLVTSHRTTLTGLITVSDVYDLHAYDAATGQGLLNYFLRAVNCGALSEEEALERSGLTLEELRGRSFVKILKNRRG